MKPYLQARTAGELRDKLDTDLRSITPMTEISDAEWNERAQLRAFLKAVADADVVSYPLEIFHTSDATPDFKLSFPGLTVGIEASRITSEPLHRLKKLRHQGKAAPVVSTSPVLVDSGHMDNDELLSRTAPGAVPGDTWNTFSSEEEFWLDRAQAIIARKTEIRRKADYQDYGLNWLLLWDRLSITIDEIPTRARRLHSALHPYWKQAKTFDSVIVECAELRRFAVLSREGIQSVNC